nr:MAG TPA: hypothetical protein [Caudoviricetes sp.]
MPAFRAVLPHSKSTGNADLEIIHDFTLPFLFGFLGFGQFGIAKFYPYQVGAFEHAFNGFLGRIIGRYGQCCGQLQDLEIG